MHTIFSRKLCAGMDSFLVCWTSTRKLNSMRNGDLNIVPAKDASEPPNSRAEIQTKTTILQILCKSMSAKANAKQHQNEGHGIASVSKPRKPAVPTSRKLTDTGAQSSDGPALGLSGPAPNKDQVIKIVRQLVEVGKKYEQALATIEEERAARKDLEQQLQRTAHGSHDVEYLESRLSAAELEANEQEVREKMLTGLLAVYQAKLKNVSEMFRLYTFSENENNIKIAQLQRDLLSMETLVAEQKLFIEEAERSGQRNGNLLQQEQQSKQILQERVDSLQQQLQDKRRQVATLEATAQQQDYLIAAKDQAYARLEERYNRLQDELNALRVGAVSSSSARSQVEQPMHRAPANVEVPSVSSGSSIVIQATTYPPVAEVGNAQLVNNTNSTSTVSRPPPGSTARSTTIYASEEEQTAHAQDQSYGALFDSVNSSSVHNLSFESSVTAHTLASAAASLTSAAQAASGVREAGAQMLPAEPSASPAASRSIAPVVQAVTNAQHPTLNSAASTTQAGRTALDPTPMKRRGPRRLAEAVTAASTDAVELPAAAAAESSLHSSRTNVIQQHAATVDTRTAPVSKAQEAVIRPALKKKPTADAVSLTPDVPDAITPAKGAAGVRGTSVPISPNEIASAEATPIAQKVKKVKSAGSARDTSAVEDTAVPRKAKKASRATGGKVAKEKASPESDRHRTFAAPSVQSLHPPLSAAVSTSMDLLALLPASKAQKAVATPSAPSTARSGERKGSGAPPGKVAPKQRGATRGGDDATGASRSTVHMPIQYDDTLFNLIDGI